jgi:hypothetical protein
MNLCLPYGLPTMQKAFVNQCGFLLPLHGVFGNYVTIFAFRELFGQDLQDVEKMEAYVH